MNSSREQCLYVIGKYIDNQDNRYYNEYDLDHLVDLFKNRNDDEYADTLILVIIFWYINLYIKTTKRLTGIKYSQYLKTLEWKAKRKVIIRLYKRCQLCGEKMDIYHIHHNNYSNLPTEELQDLVVLCEYHYMQFHRDKESITKYAKNMLSWVGK